MIYMNIVVIKMGFKVTAEVDSKNGSVTTTYSCSNCGYVILKTAERSGEFLEINWYSIPYFCICGEKFLISVSRFIPIIDKAESFEV